MGNPQKENGFTPIANEIMEALARAKISGRDFNVLLFVIRKTYGFNKKVDFIALSQIAKHCFISKIRASQVMTRLVLMNLLTVKENINGIGKSYLFNKHYEQWSTVKENLNSKGKPIVTVKENLNRPLRKTLTTKDIYTKETIQKKEYPLFEELWSKYPNKDGKKAALKHFESSVKTEKDERDIRIALDNYLNSERVLKGFIKNGSTWFNNWQDWIDVDKPKEKAWGIGA